MENDRGHITMSVQGLVRFGNGEMFVEKEMISNIFLGNGVLAEVMWEVLPKAARSAIAKSLLKSAQPRAFVPVEGAVDYAYVRWFCRCIATRFGDADVEVPRSIYWCALQNIGTRESRRFEQFLGAAEKNGGLSESESKEICALIAEMKEQHSGLYFALNPEIDRLLDRVDPSYVFSNFQLSSFSLNSKFNDAYFPFFDIQTVDSNSFREFWMIPNILSNDRIAMAFQKLFHCAEPFPTPSKLMESDNFLTLLNFSICKRRTFFDLVMQSCRGFLVERKYEECERYTEPFPEVRPIVLLSEYEAMKGDPTTFETGVTRFLPHCDLAIARQILPRFANDMDLISLLRNMTGSRLNSGDLLTRSIPNFLNNNLRTFDLEELLEFRSKKFFVVSDKDRVIDFSFMNAYKALSEVIDKIGDGEDVPEFSDLVCMISSNDVKCDTISAIFSLIFLRDSTGKFICSPAKAQSIVSVLMLFDPDNKYIKRASELLQYAIEVGFSTLEDTFEPLGNQFLDLLGRKSYQVAKKLVEANEKMLRIVHVAEALDKLAKGDTIEDYEGIDKSLLSAECYLSLNRDLGLKSSHAAQLVADRKSGPCDPLELFELSSLRNIIVRLEEDITDPGLNISHYHMLKAFSDFERTQKRGQSGIQSVSDIVAELLGDSQTTWSHVEAILGKERAPEQIFQYGQSDKVAKKGDVYETLREQFPLPLVCLTHSASDVYPNNKAIQAAVMETNNICPESTIEDVEAYLKECDQRLIDIPTKDIETMAKKLVASKPLQTDLLHLLYLRDPAAVDRVVNPLLLELDIRTIQQLDSFRTHDILYMLDGSNFTVHEALDDLLNRHYYEVAKRFAADLSLNKELRIKVQKIIKEANEDDLYRIERVFSEYANQIMVRREELAEMNMASEEMSYCHKLEKAKGSQYSQIIDLLEEVQKSADVITIQMMTHIVAVSTDYLERLYVDSLESEMEAMTKISRLANIIFHLKLKMKNASEVAQFGTWFIQLQHIDRFVNCGVFAKFNIAYTLKAFSGREAGKRFAKICRKNDYKHLMRDIQSAWQISDGVYEPAMMCFELGMLHHGLVELRIAANFVKIMNNVDTRIDDEALVKILTHPPLVDLSVFEPERDKSEEPVEISRTRSLTVIGSDELPLIVQRINEGSVACPMVHEEVKKKLRDDQEFGFIIGSPQISTLNQSLDILQAYEAKIMYLSRNGLFDDALLLYSTHFLNQHNRTSLFLKTLLTPAIAYQNWNGFLRKLMKQMSLFTPVITDVFKWLGKHGLVLCMYELQKGVAFFGDAIRTGVSLLAASTSWDDPHMSLPDTELFMLKQRVSLLLPIWKRFVQNKEPFNKDFTLLGSTEKALKLGAHLLSQFQVGVASEICILPNVTLEDMCDLLLDELSQKDGQIPQFFSQLTRLDNSTYVSIVDALMNSIHRRSASERSFVAFVKSSVKGNDIRAKTLARFGFISDAEAVAKGNDQLIAECRTIYQRQKQSK